MIRPRRTKRVDKRRADLCSIIGDGAAYSVMVGLGETYVAAFVLAIGLGQVAAGLVAAVPMLAGSVLQLVSPRAVQWFGSHRRWVVMCASFQALSLLPLAVGAWTHTIPGTAVFACVTLYWGAGMAAAPAWNTWVGRLVPGVLRARFFARRSRVSQAAVFIGFAAGGIVLHLAAQRGDPLPGFMLVFLAAAGFRAISAWMLARQSEASMVADTYVHVGGLEFVRRLMHGSDGRLLIFIISLQAAVQLAGPYFTPFMLGQLEFSYVQYVTLIAASFLAKFVALPVFGKLAQHHGPRWICTLGALGIVPISGLWTLAHAFPYLLALQCLSGMAWAAYELGSFLLLFETIPERERTSMLTLFNLVHAIATVVGALIGAALLRSLGGDLQAYLVLFAASSFARSGALLLLRRVPEGVTVDHPIATRVVAVRPGDGSFGKPILPSVPDLPASGSGAQLPRPSPTGRATTTSSAKLANNGRHGDN